MKIKLLVSLFLACLIFSACQNSTEVSQSSQEASESASEASESKAEEVTAQEEKSPSDRLLDALGEKAEGRTLIETGEEEVEGEMCVTFALGTNTPEKFTAEEHFAVGKDKIYIMDIIGGGNYVPFEN